MCDAACMVNALLRPEDQQLVSEERRVLETLRDALVRLEATPENLEALSRSLQQLDELFLVAGIDDVVMDAFAGQLTVYPSKNVGWNPNTSDTRQLVAAAAAMAIPPAPPRILLPEFVGQLETQVSLARQGGTVALPCAQFAGIVEGLGAFCSAERAEDVRRFFATHAVSGAERTLRQALERIEQCAATAEVQQPHLGEWLSASASEARRD